MRNIGIVAQLHLGIATMSEYNTKFTKFSLKCHPIHPGIRDHFSTLRENPGEEVDYDNLLEGS